MFISCNYHWISALISVIQLFVNCDRSDDHRLEKILVNSTTAKIKEIAYVDRRTVLRGCTVRLHLMIPYIENMG